MLAAFLITLALGGMQIFIGGTRLVFSLPIYALLGLAGLLALFSLRRSKPLPGRICLWSSALFFGYILLRAWFRPCLMLKQAILGVGGHLLGVVLNNVD